MGFNTDASRVSLPRGRVFFARKSAAGVLGPFLHLGNCSKLEFARSEGTRLNSSHQSTSRMPSSA